MQISYAPSLTALREMRKQPRQLIASSSFVGFGNPTFSKMFTNRVELAYADSKVEPSIQQEEEVKRVAQTYGDPRNRVFVGTSATEDRFKLEASKADVLHFAAPALFDETSPMSSFIGLAPGTSNQDEGFLQAREIINLQTTAQLVVLSSAQAPRHLQGLAMPGVSWSWFVAGAPAMMVSRWQVEPAVRLNLLTSFYSAIRPKRGTPVSKATSLHRSMMSLRRSAEYRHPHYWAGFSIIGNAQ
jgi:CHAT domain-containing protein